MEFPFVLFGHKALRMVLFPVSSSILQDVASGLRKYILTKNPDTLQDFIHSFFIDVLERNNSRPVVFVHFFYQTEKDALFSFIIKSMRPCNQGQP